jgi:peroxiredoxin
MMSRGALEVLGRGLLALVLAAASGAIPLWADVPSTPAAEAQARPGPIERGEDADATALVGTRPPALPSILWLDGRKRSLASLAGQVVLIRSFTDTCPYCVASVPSLESLHRGYAERGLVVLGVYHPKPPRPVASDEVARFARSLGATFPIGLDPDWRLVESWWLERSRGDWTSVTWILDRGGVLRYVHPGGEYHAGGGPDHGRCRSDERHIREIIDRLLKETPTWQPTSSSTSK